ncbi:MAG TPA: hypothetical protein VK177_04085 [Flavobacteriales bacterium]|nr:hypothetical protein [Flavobacteriales bacterium]
MKTINMLLLAFTLLVIGCKKNKENFQGSGSKIVPRDILSSEKYDEVLIEIAYEGDHAPSQEAVDHFRNFVLNRVNKPKGISIMYNPIPNQNKTMYTVNDINGIEIKYRKEYPRKKKLTLFVFYANADYAGNTGSAKIMGVAYGSSSFAVFGKTTTDYSGGITQPSQFVLEATVFEHEMAHLFGLVNYGSPMVVAHEANDHHCNNEDCLMYYTVETTDFVANLVGGSIPGLDQHCIDDVRANGGK